MIKAVLFDTFGTIVDWRSSIARESAVFAKLMKSLILTAMGSLALGVQDIGQVWPK